MEDLFDAIDGAVFGLAIGDALGLPASGKSAEWIMNNLGGVYDYPSEGGYTSDASEIPLLILASVNETGFFDLYDISARLRQWFALTESDLGATTRKALTELSEGVPPEESGKAALSELAAGSGALCRAVPAVTANLDSFNNVIQQAIDLSVVTHFHPSAVAGSIAASIMLYELFQNRNAEAALNNLISHRGLYEDSDIERVVLQARLANADSLEHTAWVAHTLQTALWSLLNTDTFESAVLMSVNFGGDANTTGALTGAFAGALYGKNAIPERLFKRLAPLKQITATCAKLRELKNADYIEMTEMPDDV